MALFDVCSNSIADSTPFQFCLGVDGSLQIVAQQKFDVGVMTSFDYNNTKKDLTLAQSQLLQAKYDFIFKTTILEFYMGNPIKIDRE